MPCWACQDGVRGRYPQGLPQARQEAPSRPQPRRQGGRGEVQGDLAGQRHPGRSREAPRFDAGEIDASGQEMPPRGFYRDQAGGFGPAPSTSTPASRVSSTWAGSFRKCSGSEAAAPAAGAAWIACEAPIRATAQGAFPGRRPRRQAARQPARRQDARHRRPRRHKDGQTLRLKGQGMPARKGRPAGDAYVEIHVEPHAPLRAARQRHPCRAAGDPHRGGAGRPVPVPTVGGPVTMNVPGAPTPARRCG